MKTIDFKTSPILVRLKICLTGRESTMDDATPMLRQYLDIKKLYPGTLLMFRLGDFYELFNEDAIIGSRELQITLTARHKDSKNPIPMCGVPHHAAANYIAKLVRRGYRVAICEQAEAAGKGTKLVRREVVRVVTPGTAIDPQLVEAKDSVYLGTVTMDDGVIGAAFLELSTGEFSATQLAGNDAWAKFRELLDGYSPRTSFSGRTCSRGGAASCTRRWTGIVCSE